MRAYKTLEIRDPDLVADYACYLDSARTSTPTLRTLSPKLIEAVIEQKLQDNEAKKLVFNLGSKSIKVREQGEKLIKFILWSDGIISAAVSAQPYAALAWSGVSLLLPVCFLITQFRWQLLNRSIVAAQFLQTERGYADRPKLNCRPIAVI